MRVILSIGGVVLLVAFLLGVGFLSRQNEKQEMVDSVDTLISMSTLTLKSRAFLHEGQIPAQYTCSGNDMSPPLSIDGVPEDTKSLALIMDDPDAPVGTWDHWVVFNIPPKTRTIAEGVEPEGIGGNNSWGRTGYGGPCPPDGAHHYIFKLYALDTELDLHEGIDKKSVENAMKDHILAETKLVGTYSRSQ